MRKILLLVFLPVLGRVCALAQNSYDYYYNNLSQNQHAADITPDMDLFFVPVGGGGDIFTALSDFNFSSVKYSRRGYPRHLTRTLWGNIDLSGVVSHAPDYALPANLRRANARSVRFTGMAVADRDPGLTGGVVEYGTDVRSIFSEGFGVSVGTFDRRGRAAMKVSAAGAVDGMSDYGMLVSRRWGRDRMAEGVFIDETSFTGGIDRRIADDHGISFFAGATLSESGLRSYAVREVFELTGNNMYNPSWGYYGGERKNSKTAAGLRPFVSLNYEGRVGENTTIGASASYRFGEERRSALSWFDAENPYPDYYRYLPGYEASNGAAAWRANDPAATRIFWEQLVEQNLNDPDNPAYVFEDRVERFGDVQFGASVRTFIEPRLSLTCGVRLQSDRRRCYKELKDMLGARSMIDADQYLVDDDVFGGRYRNDMRNPDRRVGKGDRFGYDYLLTGVRTTAFAVLKYRFEKFRFECAMEAGRTTLRRRGFYEKEIFPGDGSLGLSRACGFNPYIVKASAGYSFSARHFADVTAVAAGIAPYAGNIFLNPDYSNAVMDNPQAMKLLSAGIDYAAAMRRFSLRISAFATATSGESAVYRYWDDVEAAYSDMAVRGMNKLYRGAEAALQYEISPRLTLRTAASAGSYRYDSNPEISILDDATRFVIAGKSKSHMKGYHIGSSPEMNLTAEMRYSSQGWLASLTASRMGGRYVDISPLRRMERAYTLAGSPETLRDFTGQERLGDAVTLNLFVLRSFDAGRGRITAMLAIDNVLGTEDIVYNGFEQMRIVKKGTAPNLNWQPFPNKYLYGYGRTFHASLTYSF